MPIGVQLEVIFTRSFTIRINRTFCHFESICIHQIITTPKIKRTPKWDEIIRVCYQFFLISFNAFFK
jgi:hypothetical protein